MATIEMLKRTALSFAVCIGLAPSLFAQPGSGGDPTLFTVGGQPVTVSEFKYIYSKTNQDKADYSEASLRDYLDLYTKFKLKVRRAKEMQLDTAPALRQELEGYRQQLANSYLVDKEVTDRLIRDVYERTKKDIDFSHIFIACDKNASPADTLKAYEKAMSAIQRLKKGEKFDVVALELSGDPTVKDNKGHIGFFTAMLPDGFYSLENAMYETPVGKVAERPARTAQGYHVVRIEGERPARGQVEVAQILIRKDAIGAEKAKMRADSAFAALKAGADWAALCAAISQDKMSAPKGGNIGFFGINQYQKPFEEAAFALANVGDISLPVETTIGFHIIKLLNKKGVEPFEKARRPLSERVKRDARAEAAKQNMIARIKKDGGFKENRPALEKFKAQQIDSIFLTFRWKPTEPKPADELFSFSNGAKYSLGDFESYCQRAGRQRMRGTGGANASAETVEQLYKQFVDESSLKFEETQLDKKYPEFKNLMREYEEGILLFEALKQLVWDKANNDTVGLERFYVENLKGKYAWEERMVTTTYSIKTDDTKLKAKVLKAIAKKPAVEVVKKFNKTGQTEVVSFSERTTERSKLKDPIPWQAGYISEPKMDEKTKSTIVTKVEKLLPVGPKSLNEARGYAVADYQDWLEKQWIAELQKAYKVDVNEAVFRSLIVK